VARKKQLKRSNNYKKKCKKAAGFSAAFFIGKYLSDTLLTGR
jgi:hypothetical protein